MAIGDLSSQTTTFNDPATLEKLSNVVKMPGPDEIGIIGDIPRKKLDNPSPEIAEDYTPNRDMPAMIYGDKYTNQQGDHKRSRKQFQTESFHVAKSVGDEAAQTRVVGMQNRLRVMKFARMEMMGASERKILGSLGGGGAATGARNISARYPTANHQGGIKGTITTAARMASVASLCRLTSVGAGAGAAASYSNSTKLHIAPTPGTNRAIDLQDHLLDPIRNLRLDIGSSRVGTIAYMNLQLREKCSAFSDGALTERTQGANSRGPTNYNLVKQGIVHHTGYTMFKWLTYMEPNAIFIIDPKKFMLQNFWMNDLVSLPKLGNSTEYVIRTAFALTLEHADCGTTVLALT